MQILSVQINHLQQITMEISNITQQFIEQHLNDDVRSLALKKAPGDVDLQFALTQISGHRYALNKIPEWASARGIIYPKHLSLEQCTNQHIALYKRNYIKNAIGKEQWSMADFTGGMGIDCYYLSCKDRQTLYNEMDEMLCNITEHNYKILGRTDICISNSCAEEFIENNSNLQFDLAYLDPARRSAGGQKLVSLSDCMPDITQLQDKLLLLAEHVAVKVSPMLDLSKGLNELKCVKQVLVISLDGECKEMLYILERGYTDAPAIEAVNISSSGIVSDITSATPQKEKNTLANYADEMEISEGCYLYEPFAAQMKSGLYNTLADNYNAKIISPVSHLYISEKRIERFPGRRFRISESVPFNKRSAKEFFIKYPQANIAVRNFPLKAEELRMKFKIKDGGNTYIFGTNTNQNNNILIACTKDN